MQHYRRHPGARQHVRQYIGIGELAEESRNATEQIQRGLTATLEIHNSGNDHLGVNMLLNEEI